jgi:hypothetical protein
MYKLPAKATFEFQELYKKHFDKALTNEEAIKEIKDILYIQAFSEGHFYLLDKCMTLQTELDE